MKKILSFFALLISIVAIESNTHAQGAQLVYLNASTHATVVVCDTTRSTGLLDDGGETGNYTPNQDYYVTFTRDCGTSRICVILSELDVAPTDTIYVYDGADTNGTLLAKINNSNGDWINREVFVSPNENTNQVTIRFRVKENSVCGAGFSMLISCGIPCESVVPIIDDFFYRTRNGQIYDTAYLKQVAVYDTTFNIQDNDTLGIDHIDTNYFTGANLCIGDGVIFNGHCDYSFDHGYYTPSDATTTFQWVMGTYTTDAHIIDTLRGAGLTSVSYTGYQTTGCYDVILSAVDEYGCENKVYTSIRVRTSLNPIKTIFTLADICNNNSLMVNMGYDGENATLTLKKIEQVNTVTKVNEVRTFIPDGQCPIGGQAGGGSTSCYLAPVTFTEFPASRTVQSPNDICSICINMEHTYMGDLTLSIVCPTGQEAFIFYGNQDSRRPQGVSGGGGKYMGYPIRNIDGSDRCDSLQSPFGEGLDYCFTRNSQYTLVTGDNANISGIPTGDYYIVSNGYMDNYSVTLPPIPSYMSHGGEVLNLSGSTKHPSNHEEKSDYYLPHTDFSELVGCPLNGTWAINICDYWGADNGWVFNWSMDICDVSTDNDCKYNVGIDSLVWRPNPDAQYHDYELGHYRGLQVEATTPTISYISSPDTAGTFPIDVLIYDEFGCIWDTNTKITTYWTPIPDLGPDTGLCGDTQMELDATDRHAATENYAYLWEPFGEDTPTIITSDQAGSDLNYIVRVINYRGVRGAELRCTGFDTINVKLLKQPLPSFMPEPFTLEGCAPLTLTFENQTIDGDGYFWDFGDGVTSTRKNPTHTWDAGIYDLKYYATSNDGCIDSVIMKQTIAAYAAPEASYEWTPIYPSVMDPIVTFNNTTTPDNPENKYFWEIQYNQDNPLSVHTITDKNPTYNFAQYADEDNLAGNYIVRLIARSDNLAPSGNFVYCRDTTENSVLVINDFLEFPNVVTPNGDGINDRFIIRGLVEGMGYPINSLDIYNKWGTRVFHRENIKSMDDFWDPSSLPSGTYFFRFSARGYNGNVEHNGAIEVIKD